MNKSFVFMLLLFSLAISQSFNYAGIDTSIITGFKGDTTIYSKVYNLSQYENVRIDVQANDTSSNGFASDSIKFGWWVETGRFTYNSTGRWDTAWTVLTPLSLDTFDIATTANMVVSAITLQTDGTFETVNKKIDTLSVSGVAYMTKQFSPEWDVLFRIGHKGVTGNRVTSQIWLRDVVYRRVYQRVGP